MAKVKNTKLKIYKNNYMNEEYFEQHGFPKDFPTSLQELEDSEATS